MLVPAELGGGGATFADACAVLTTLAHGCPSTSLTLSMHIAPRRRPGLASPSGPARARAPPGRGRGPGAGVDRCRRLDRLERVARKVEGGYRVSGRKTPSSGAPAGAIVVTSARWENAPDGPQVVHCPSRSPPRGCRSRRPGTPWACGGRARTPSCSTTSSCPTPPSRSSARPGVWHPVWATVLGCALPLIMSTYVGVAEAAVGRALELAARRAERPDTAPAVGRMIGQLDRGPGHGRAPWSEPTTICASTPTLASAAAAPDPQGERRRRRHRDGAAGAWRSAAGRPSPSAAGSSSLLRDVHGATYHPLPPAAAAAVHRPRRPRRRSGGWMTAGR